MPESVDHQSIQGSRVEKVKKEERKKKGGGREGEEEKEEEGMVMVVGHLDQDHHVIFPMYYQ